jgi:type VI secretion system secreted protein VgrG
MEPSSINYQLTVDGHTQPELEVLDFETREALSDGCAAVVHAMSATFFDGATLVGKPAALAIDFGQEHPRVFRGIVARCTLRKASSVGNLFEVEIQSRLWLLGLGRDNRVFTKATEHTVVQQVLEKAGIPKDDQTWSLSKEPAEKQHIFQRDESNLAFVQRLLAREGIGYAIHNDPAAAKEQIVFFDNSKKLPAITGGDTLYDRSSSAVAVDVVYDVRQQARVRSDAVMMRDYDPALPGADLDAKAPPKGGGVREIYLHPGGYNDQTVGQRLAERALDATRVAAHTITGSSDCPRLEAGRAFAIDGNPRHAVNGRYLVVEIVHRGHSAAAGDGRPVAYENAFTAVKQEDVLFRPARPVRPGRACEVAFVTVPSGEEIHVDEFGRSTVRFPWDRSGQKDHKSSGFLRVGQLPLSGSMTLPRQGFEVIVDYELGEIDRPYVSGHLYNGTVPPPYALPHAATCSSIQTATTSGGPGANEVRFDDTAGSEEMFFNASKDITISVDNDATFSANKNEKSTIGSNAELKVGTDHVAHVIANRKLQVGSTLDVNVSGDYSESVGKNASVQVGAVRKVQCGGDHTEGTAGALTRTVAGLQSVTGLKAVSRNVIGASQVSAGAAWAEVVARSRASDVAGSRTETVGALKLIKAKQVAVSCGGTLTVNAAANLVSCGGTRTDNATGAITLASAGGISVKAKSITIEAKQKLVMMLGGCLFELSKGGKVHIKAASIDLKGAKSLGQVKHGSN